MSKSKSKEKIKSKTDKEITTKEKKCLVCKKTLLDEKLPLCARCRIKGKEKAVQGGTFVVGTVVAAVGAIGTLQSKDEK